MGLGEDVLRQGAGLVAFARAGPNLVLDESAHRFDDQRLFVAGIEADHRSNLGLAT